MINNGSVSEAHLSVMISDEFISISKQSQCPN